MVCAQGLGLGLDTARPPSAAWSRPPALGRTHSVRGLGTQGGSLQREDRLREMSRILLQLLQGHDSAVPAAPAGGGGVSRPRGLGCRVYCSLGAEATKNSWGLAP